MTILQVRMTMDEQNKLGLAVTPDHQKRTH